MTLELFVVSARTNKRYHHQGEAGAHSTTPTYTVGRDSPARKPSWSAFWLQKPSILRACVREEDAGGREAGAHSATPTYTVRRDSPAREPMCVCVFITAGPSTKLFTWGGGDMGGHVLRETTLSLAVIERKFSIGTPCFCFLSDGSKLGDRIVAMIKLCILVMYFPEKILRSFPMCSVVQIIPHIRKKSQATLEKCPDP
jgi:hypothetical protein